MLLGQTASKNGFSPTLDMGIGHVLGTYGFLFGRGGIFNQLVVMCLEDIGAQPLLYSAQICASEDTRTVDHCAKPILSNNQAMWKIPLLRKLRVKFVRQILIKELNSQNALTLITTQELVRTTTLKIKNPIIS